MKRHLERNLKKKMKRNQKSKLKTILLTIMAMLMTLLMAMSMCGCGGKFFGKHASLADYIPDMEDTVSLCIGEIKGRNDSYVEVSENEKSEIIKYLTELNLDGFEETELSGVGWSRKDESIYVRFEYEGLESGFESGFESGKAGLLYSVIFTERESGQYILLNDVTEARTVLKADKGTFDMAEIKAEIEKYIYENCDKPDYELGIKPDEIIKTDENIKTFADYLPELKETEKVWLFNPGLLTEKFNHVESDVQEEILNTLLSLNLESFKIYHPYGAVVYNEKIPNSGEIRARVALGKSNKYKAYEIGVAKGKDELYAYIKDERGFYIECLRGKADAFDYEKLGKKMNGYLK